MTAAAAMNFSGRGAARPPSISVVSMFSSVLRIVAGMGVSIGFSVCWYTIGPYVKKPLRGAGTRPRFRA